ncbi:Cytidine and deoxycytidylate deaminase zinc-binding region [Penicillium taxi]|uniref:Cytidine and deoxycytidylate deaminase zinc-binding region n=1 Tax=Penicillium taxi TaxID=168475 RepID=UPI002544FC50|nr:Cytidine and deoxycytidylate deaminase zinc-binding region [Penicillium taxi]KAJ5895621.1 Cytidine and deoxycytidylate deaminase zinc-binding region [Penicillium taxi]
MRPSSLLGFLPAQAIISDPALTINNIPFTTRAHWMRLANAALKISGSPCPFAAFGTVIVNHTDTSGLGELVCMGTNQNMATGNPTLHGTYLLFIILNVKFLLT